MDNAICQNLSLKTMSATYSADNAIEKRIRDSNLLPSKITPNNPAYNLALSTIGREQ